MRKHRHLLLFLAAALVLGAGARRRCHADERRRIRLPIIGVQIGPGRTIGVGIAPAPPGGMGMAHPPVAGMGMAHPPVAGMGMAHPPVGGMGMAHPPITGVGMAHPPVGGMGMTHPPMTGMGTTAAPMSRTLAIHPPIVGRWIDTAKGVTITFLPGERYENGAVCGTFFLGAHRGQYAIRGGSPYATVTFTVGSRKMNVNVTFTNLNMMTWYFGGEELVLYKAG